MHAQSQGSVNGNRKSQQPRQLKIYSSRDAYTAGAPPVNVSPVRDAISAADFAEHMAPLEFAILWGEDGRMVDTVEIPASSVLLGDLGDDFDFYPGELRRMLP